MDTQKVHIHELVSEDLQLSPSRSAWVSGIQGGRGNIQTYLISLFVERNMPWLFLHTVCVLDPNFLWMINQHSLSIHLFLPFARIEPDNVLEVYSLFLFIFVQFSEQFSEMLLHFI